MELRLVLVGLVVVLPLGACGAGGAPNPGADSPTPTVHPRPLVAAPEGTRWQGIDGVVVAVPDDWDTVTDPCGRADGDSVRFLAARSPSSYCPSPGTAASVLLIAPSGARLRDRHVRCRAGSVGPCTLTFGVPAGDAVFRVTYRGPDPDAFVRRLRGSVTVLPAGYTTVPPVAFGSSVDQAMAQLGAAGLVGSSPDVDFPHYATGTSPVAGTVVEEGATVELTIGDG